MRKGVSWTTTGELAPLMHCSHRPTRRSPNEVGISAAPASLVITSGWALVRWVVGFTEEAGLSDEELQEVYERAKADTVSTCPRGLPHRRLGGFVGRPAGALGLLTRGTVGAQQEARQRAEAARNQGAYTPDAARSALLGDVQGSHYQVGRRNRRPTCAVIASRPVPMQAGHALLSAHRGERWFCF